MYTNLAKVFLSPLGDLYSNLTFSQIDPLEGNCHSYAAYVLSGLHLHTYAYSNLL